MAKFAREHLKLSKIAVMKDMKSDYSVGLASFFQDTFTQMGGTIVTEETYAASDIDFNAQLINIKGKKPDGIFLPGYYTEVGLIANQARKAGLTVPLLGGDGWDSTKLYEIGKEAVVGGYFSNHYTTDTKDTLAKEFLEAYKTQFGEVPDGLAAMGYDAAKVLADSINRAGSLASADIRNAIAATKDFAGVTGKITIDEKRNATKSAVVVKVAGATNQYVTTINP
jgi:branched-chain amino acid transport system substrate-binding protein